MTDPTDAKRVHSMDDDCDPPHKMPTEPLVEGFQDKVTRIVLVNEHGTVYTRMDLDVKISLQDQGRTLKLFVKDAKP